MTRNGVDHALLRHTGALSCVSERERFSQVRTKVAIDVSKLRGAEERGATRQSLTPRLRDAKCTV